MLQCRFFTKTHGNAWKHYVSLFRTCRFRCCCEVPMLSDIPTMLTMLYSSEWWLVHFQISEDCICSVTEHHFYVHFFVFIKSLWHKQMCELAVYIYAARLCAVAVCYVKDCICCLQILWTGCPVRHGYLPSVWFIELCTKFGAGNGGSWKGW